MRLLILLFSVVVVAFGAEVSAGKKDGADFAYLCPPLSFGSTPSGNDVCICTATNWSDKARDITMELLDTDGNIIGGTTELVQPEASARVAVSPTSRIRGGQGL